MGYNNSKVVMTNQQRVMPNIKGLLIRALLIVGVLVVGTLFAAHLFGQQGNGLFSKEGKQNDQVLEQSEKTQTPVEGDLVEYVKNNYEDYKRNITVSQYLVSPDNNQIVFLVVHADEVITGINQATGYVYEVFYLNRDNRSPHLIAKNSSLFKNTGLFVKPVIWLGNDTVVLEAYDEFIGEHKGLAVVNLDKFDTQVIPMPDMYIGFKVFDNDSKIMYPYASSGELMRDGEGFAIEGLPRVNSYGVYDLVTKETKTYKTLPIKIQQELEQQNNTSAKNSDPSGQNFSTLANGCTLSGVPTLYLPWVCNKAMLVQRDGPQNCSGNCVSSNPNYDWNTEYADCNLSVGSTYSNASGGCPGTCGHSRPAIDFGDAALWFQTGTPVLATANGEVQLKVDPNTTSGGGNMLIIRHPKSGGGYVYTYCMHTANGSIPGWIPLNNTWAAVTRGTQIGLEGATGGPYSPHYHFELKDAVGGNSYYPVFMEYGGCTPKTGYTYISKNVPTDGSMQLGYDCNYVTNLTCSNTQTLMNLTNNGASSRFATYGNGYHNWDEYGPERLYKITTTQTGTITATLSGVNYINGNDLDVFILRNPSSTSCSNLDPVAHCVGTSSGFTSAYANAPAGTYYIVVDGYNGSTANYNLTVNAPCSSGNSLPNLTDYGSSYTSNGNTLTITAKPVNYGTVNAGAFSIGYWLSPDNTFGNGNDIGLASVNYSGLSANSYNQFTFSVNTSGIAPIGNYYILFKIDYQNQVTESNETDNVWMFNTPYYLPTSVSSKTNPALTPTKQIVADGIDEVIDNEEWTDRYEETQLLSGKHQEQEIWLWKDGYDRWVALLQSGEVLTITDITGKVIKTLESREDGELWLPKLPNGVYVVSICCDGMNNEKVGKIMY